MEIGILERVGWAIREAIAEERDPARAAILAMGEPTKEMKDAFVDAMANGLPNGFAVSWQAALLAALEGGK